MNEKDDVVATIKPDVSFLSDMFEWAKLNGMKRIILESVTDDLSTGEKNVPISRIVIDLE